MRVVIDLQASQGDSRRRGIGRYALDLACAIARNRGEHEILIALNDRMPESIEDIRVAFHGLLPPDAIRVWATPGPTHWLDAAHEGRRHDAELIREAFLASLKPDAVLVASLFEGLADDVVTSIGRLVNLPTAVVLYDLIPLLNPEQYLGETTRRTLYMQKVDHLRRADLLLAISRSAAQEAITALGWKPENVANIAAAVGPDFRPRTLSADERDALAQTYGLNRDFLLSTGGFEPRKNLERLIRAFGALPEAIRKRHQLALVGKVYAEDRQTLANVTRSAGLSETDVVVTGFVDDDELLRFYAGCKAFVFPSLHEGFGLPALEAMQCGKAVIASNTSSLPEVVSSAEALFDPRDEADITRHIERVLTDDAFREALEARGLVDARGFSWDISAQTALSELEKAFATRAPAARPEPANARPRLAFVSPMPPARSGVAHYAGELLPFLAQHYDVDVIVAHGERFKPSPAVPVAVRDVDFFRANAHRYDRVLYQIGNSPFHAHIFALLEEIPGVAVLHDFFLSNVLLHCFPSDWHGQLRESHGYHALLGSGGTPGDQEATQRFPANLSVLQNALGIVVHSNHARHLADEWYGEGTATDWAVIPLLRVPATTSAQGRALARAELGIPEDTLLICSFGFVDPTKFSERILDAFLASSFAGDAKVQLAFVGACSQPTLGDSMAAAIGRAGLSARVRITGWTDEAVYRRYLEAADIAVQLRTQSRGETSAAVLDCLNYGIATIANAHGSMTELDPSAVWLLPDDFEDAALTSALETLAADADLRTRLSRDGQAVAHRRHDPATCAQAYREAIERIYADPALAFQRLPGQLAEARDPDGRHALAEALAFDFPPFPRRRQMLIDVSQQMITGAHTGIQRVTRALLLDLLQTPPEGWSIMPVYRDGEGTFHYARGFVTQFLGFDIPHGDDMPADAWPGDVFLDVDIHPGTEGSRRQLDLWKRRGVEIFHVVYDLLPVRMPDKFPDHMGPLFRSWLGCVARATGAVCISRAVADDLATWMGEEGPARSVPLRVGWFHLGADVANSVPTRGLPPDAPRVLARLAQRPTFLMVGTVEPRKGHRQTLDAVEMLWRRGVDINLVIIGMPGWHVDDIVARLRNHPELGQRLFWIQGASDEYLESIYAAATCLIAASEGEGFGLPLIEAAQHGLPILARGLPVFREIAGAHASYFDGLDPADLADAIDAWLADWRSGVHVRSEAMSRLTWSESTEQMLQGLGIEGRQRN